MKDGERRARMRTSFRSLFEIAKALASDVELEEILRHVSREACTLVDAESCSVMMLDQSQQRLLTAAAFGLTPEEERGISFRMGEGVAGWVAQRAKAVRIDDVAADPRFVASPRQVTKIRALVCVPLCVQGDCVGVVTCTCATRAFDAEDEDMLLLLADTVVLELEMARLKRMAYTDALTGTLSRLGLDASLEREVVRARRERTGVGVALVDVDRFKRVNDERGHPAGDALLAALAARLRGSVRQGDQVFRYGGEEFLVLAPGVSLARARAIAERIRRAVADAPFEVAGAPLSVTISAGVAVLRDEDDANGRSLVARADQALLAAKRAGRNRVEVAG